MAYLNGTKVNNAVLPNLEPFFAAGIDPKTGLPLKVVSGDKCHLKEDVKKFLRLVDEQDAVNRYKWGIPEKVKITSQELERLIYYKGQLGFFYDSTLDEYFFMPMVLDGTIDYYSRWRRVHPVPMTSGTQDTKANSKLANLLALKKLDVIYTKPTEPIEDVEKVTVLLHDYTKQLAQTIIPRVQINDPILDVMAECVPMARTARILATGVKGMRVGTEEEAFNVKDANRALEKAAMTGEGYIPVVGQVEFQELNPGAVAKSEEYMLAMQSLDNLRLSGYGIDNGGLFEKKAHELQSEADINGGPVGLVLQDGLEIRKHFIELVKEVFGIEFTCEIAQSVKEQQDNTPMEDEPKEESSEGETPNE